MKQLIKDPCGRSPFQGSKEGEKGPWGIPLKITRKVGVSNKIIHESEEPKITRRGCVENVNGECHVRSCKEARSNENKGQSRLHGRVVRLGWVESQEKLADFTGATGSDDESPPPSGNNSKQEVTVEVHPDHSYCLQESFKKNCSDEQGPQALEKHNMQEVTLGAQENHDKSVENSNWSDRHSEEYQTSRGDYVRQNITGEAYPDPNGKKSSSITWDCRLDYQPLCMKVKSTYLLPH